MLLSEKKIEEISSKIMEQKHFLSKEEEAEIDIAIDTFLNDLKSKEINESNINEGFLGSILGGLTGFALGSSVGKVIAGVLGAEKNGMLYNLLTSRAVGTAVGYAIGKAK